MRRSRSRSSAIRAALTANGDRSNLVVGQRVPGGLADLARLGPGLDRGQIFDCVYTSAPCNQTSPVVGAGAGD
jgi:hypothetical protein